MSAPRRSRSSGSRQQRGAPGKHARRPPKRASTDARVVWPPKARSHTARDTLEGLMRERGLQRGFEGEVEREAERSAACKRSHEGRADLRELVTFTVDPSTARDFDDAISAEHLPDGRTRVWVHIADVSAHVPQGSAVDVEARRRATSVYVPGAVEPMLPHALSSNACSLVPGSDRLTVTVEMELQGAQIVSRRFYRSVIRSNMRLDYEQVDRIFAGTDTASDPWGSSLQAARAAAAELAEKRERSGALVIDSEEPEFEFDQDGEVKAIHARVHTESHRLIEHLMIAANEAVAAHLFEQGVGCLYRVHERPDPQRILALVEQLASLEVPTPPIPNTLTTEQAADLVGEISRRVDAHVRRAGHGRIALSSLVLRSLKQAYYSPANLGHAGLHSACYCHFTSPIRRYPDLVCHRALLSTLGFPERPPSMRKLADLGEWASEREREAAMIERDADDIAACFHLERQLLEEGFDRVFAGEVTGLVSGGAFVVFGPEPLYEGMIPLRLMRSAEGRMSDWWELNEQRTMLRAKRSGAVLRLGDRISVRALRVDATRGRVDLEPADVRSH
ncbi:MAG: ribonuclease R family protein [Solirubrobacteraceae bacterium]